MDSDVHEILTSLQAAIEKDRNMFVRAKIDPMFDSVRPQVDTLLEDICQETKVNAKKVISDADFAVQTMKSWFEEDQASSDGVQKYNFILNKTSDAKDKIKMHRYFGYDDALKIMSGTSKMIDEIQASIRDSLISSENELKSKKTQSKDIHNNITREKKSTSEFVFLISMSGFCAGYLFFSYLIALIIVVVVIWSSSYSIVDSYNIMKQLKKEQNYLIKQIKTLEQTISVAKESITPQLTSQRVTTLVWDS